MLSSLTTERSKACILPKILDTKWIHLCTCMCIHVQLHVYQKLSGSIQSSKVSHRVVMIDILTLDQADPFRAILYESCLMFICSTQSAKSSAKGQATRQRAGTTPMQSQRRSDGATWRFTNVQVTCYTYSPAEGIKTAY